MKVSEQIVQDIIDGVEGWGVDDSGAVMAHKAMLSRSRSTIALIIAHRTGCDLHPLREDEIELRTMAGAMRISGMMGPFSWKPLVVEPEGD